MDILEDFHKLNVRDALTELFNLSGLSLDLSYAAVIYGNKELAEKVLELEMYIDRLIETIRMHMCLAVRDKEDAIKSLSVFRAANTSNNISDAASEIAKIVLRDHKLDPRLRKGLLEADETVEIFKMSDDSRLIGSTIEESLMISNVGFDIIALKRDFKWTINPKNNIELAADDVLVVRGTKDALELLRGFVGG